MRIRLSRLLPGTLGCLTWLATVAGAAQLRDPLLESLDLSRPALSGVKVAYEHGDLSKARKAFADYLRQRKNVHWTIDPDHVPKGISPSDQGIADEALKHQYNNSGYTYQFGPRIDWGLDPTTQPASPIAPNPEWTWGLNRHRMWTALAASFVTNGDMKYARELCAQMQDWIHSNPPPIPQKEQFPGARWRPIEAGIRMSRVWPEVYFRMLQNPQAFPDDALLDMVDSMREHALYLEVTTAWGIRSNHITVECAGLYCVGTLFPEFKDAAQWRSDAAERQLEQLKLQVYPDGVQKELAPGYHMFALSNCLQIIDVARLNHLQLPEGYQNELEKMFGALMWEMTPNRTTPPLNDSSEDSVIDELRVGVNLFPNHPDWAYFASGGASGQLPAEASHHFDYAGWAVMRSGWNAQARFLIMECGPYGQAHQHEDKLSFILHAYGSTLVTEGGVYTYDRSRERQYVLSARAHNVIQIDGLEQYRRGGPRSYFTTETPIDIGWRSTDQYDYAQGSYGDEEDEKWGFHGVSGFLHTRRVLFIKPDYWIVFDTVRPPENTREHLYESAFHLRTPGVSVDPQTHAVRTLSESTNLAIFPVARDELNVEVVTGQKHPVYQGWEADENSLKLLPIPTPIFSQRCAGLAKFLYVFSPAKAGSAGPVKSVKPAVVDGAVMAANLDLTGGGTARAALMKNGVILFTQAGHPPIRIETGSN
jgi:hypothetical protein